MVLGVNLPLHWQQRAKCWCSHVLLPGYMPQPTTDFLGIRSLACRDCNVYCSLCSSLAIPSSIWLPGRRADVFCRCLVLFCIISFIVEITLVPFYPQVLPCTTSCSISSLWPLFFITSYINIYMHIYVYACNTHIYYIFLSKTYSVCIIWFTFILSGLMTWY